MSTQSGTDSGERKSEMYFTDSLSAPTTDMNVLSSRSHTIVLLTVMQTDNALQTTKISQLYAVDLAGSEKCSKTRAEGEVCPGIVFCFVFLSYPGQSPKNPLLAALCLALCDTLCFLSGTFCFLLALFSAWYSAFSAWLSFFSRTLCSLSGKSFLSLSDSLYFL